MKTNKIVRAFFAALVGLALASSIRAQADNATGVAGSTSTTPVLQGTPGVAGVGQPVVVPNTASAAAKWSEIKDLTYDTRDLFFAGLRQLEATVDSQVQELTARRSAMKRTTDTKAWDFAMKEMNDSRAYLKSMVDELRKADPETWDQGKERVAQAWARAQDAYNAVKKSTTS